MEEWAVVQRHVADEIVLLCHQHHGEKTNGFLPKEKVREYKASPLNLRQGVSSPWPLHFFGNTAEVKIGGNSMSCQVYGEEDSSLLPIIIDDEPQIGISIGKNHLFLSLKIYDRDGNCILKIHDNELIYSTEPWDIEIVGTKLTIREASRNITIEILFEPPNKVWIRRGRFLRNGVEVQVEPSKIFLTNGGNTLVGNTVHSIGGICGGLIIGESTKAETALYRLTDVKRNK